MHAKNYKYWLKFFRVIEDKVGNSFFGHYLVMLAILWHIIFICKQNQLDRKPWTATNISAGFIDMGGGALFIHTCVRVCSVQ